MNRHTLLTWCIALLASCAWISDSERGSRWDVDGDGVERPEDCDDGDAAVAELKLWWTDADGDGFGAEGSEVEACAPPPDAVDIGGDCDDGDDAVNPDADEICNGVDDDCDGTPDQGLDAVLMFVDADEDGFGDGEAVWVCGSDAGYAVVDGDCDDGDAAVHPAAEEVCNAVDDDCDGQVDLEDPSLDPASATWYADADLDGYGDDLTAVTTCEPDPTWSNVGGDCADDDPDRSPGADELCNFVDDDCDDTVDEDDALDAVTWYRDDDRDGFGAPLTDQRACLRPVGFVENALDCDDAESLVKPGAQELCDGVDNDCDTLVDDDDTWVGDPKTWYFDGDADGFGTSSKLVVQCSAPPDYVEKANDCRDSDPLVNPGMLEVCDGIDNDCDLAVDDADDDLDLATTPSWYVDADGDGYGDEDLVGAIACEAPPGLVADGTDCDDADSDTNPGARELCDAIDNDCDGLVDEETPTVWYADADGDGFGDPDVPLPDCNQPPGYVLDDTDCDDGLASVNPDAPEVCDGLDSDCDGLSDDEDPDSDAATWYADLDDDGFGDPWITVRSCDQPTGFLADDTDCDDADLAINPAAAEVCDGQDNDCDGFVDDADPEGANPPSWYLDGDLDGYGDPATEVFACEAPYQHVAIAGDCDDDAPTVHDGAVEVCGGLDDDCDGLVDDDDPDLDPADAVIWHADTDGDGYGDPLAPSALLCNAPLDHVEDATDCDDTNPDTWPGAAELCDSLDNDCDTYVDEDTPTPWYADLDGDGFGDGTAYIADCDPVPGHVLYAGDCDDGDPAVNPDAPEICNGVDDDCNALVDEDDPDLAEPSWYQDGDGDGFGYAFEEVIACTAPPGYVADGTDCDDGLASVNPLATEICNLRDDDCDGLADDADPSVDGAVSWYADLDDDGFGDPNSPIEACAEPPDAVLDASDCDDTDFKVHPTSAEVCDRVDNDCDTFVDDDDPDVVGQQTWFSDLDDDGYGDPLTGVLQCVAGVDQVLDDTDCDDTDSSRYPTAPEQCDGVDDDCNNVVDDNVVYQTWYADLDLDGYGDPDDAVSDCVDVAGRVLVGSDCDDSDALIHPLGSEVCNGIDDDCDGKIDDADNTLDTSGQDTWYVDADGDLYGDDATAVVSCDAPVDGINVGGDCDDTEPLVNPGETEVPGNELDEDCSGDLLCWVDADEDGFGDDAAITVLSPDLLCRTADGEALVLGDCDDAEPLVNSGNVEVVGNTLDDDCSGDMLCYVDLDGDGYGDSAGTTVVEAGDGVCDAVDGEGPNALDCDDTDATISPDATEVAGNEVDEDCSGDIECWTDLDGDGWGDDAATTVVSADPVCDPVDGEALVVGDCDDSEPLANLGMTEICNDGVDNDCDGLAPGCRTEGVIDAVSLTDLVERELAGDLAGSSLALPGDVTGDGIADLIVGAPGAGGGAGSAYVVPGPIAGNLRLIDAFELTGVGAEAAGTAVSGAGDHDGDGVGDLIVGAPFSDAGGLNRGAAFLLRGPVTAGGALSPSAVELYGSDSAERFGEAVAGPADFDGDAFPDYVIGGPNADHFTINSGSVYVMSGATAATGEALNTARAVWTAGSIGEEAGACVATGRDLDGDGRDDIVSGAPNVTLTLISQGVVDVITDPGTGMPGLGGADSHFEGAASGDRLGDACAMAGDVNGDGYGDFLMGAPSAAGGSGRAFLVLGPPTAGTTLASNADAVISGLAGSRAGAALAGPGDVDEDGLEDVLIGAPDDATNGTGAGAAYLLYGAFAGSVDLLGADLTILGDGVDQHLGTSVRGGDLDGDGKADLVLGATGDGGQTEAVYLIFGQGL